MDAGHAYADTALLDVPSCIVLTSPLDRPDASGHEDLAPFAGLSVRSGRAEGRSVELAHDIAGQQCVAAVRRHGDE
jgi:hypothetical protein